MKTLLVISFAIFAIMNCRAQQATAAKKFISGLDSAQRASALFQFDTDERYSFHFFPIENRKGIPVDQLRPAQLQAALELMKTCLSAEAVKKVDEIMQLEIVLKALEHRSADDHYRDPGKYFFAIFGVPDASNTWGWRLEGHHVSFHFSVDKNQLVAGTPGFLGANPAIVPEGPQKGKQVLREETDRAFELLHLLTNAEMKKALIDTIAPNDIITYVSRKAMIEHPVGLRYADMNGKQQEQLLRLISLYVHRYTKLFADAMLKEIEQAGLDELRFAWAGYTEPGKNKAHYYRIQGPTIIIEYDNTQNNANHVHSVVRDLKRDFGGDLLLEHYKSSH
ncbi:MAG: DUF3500 domain-containing protein [Williamsia sp.]|nr:DUF3500 domain-containing protein [Williamsia sp.]